MKVCNGRSNFIHTFFWKLEPPIFSWNSCIKLSTWRFNLPQGLNAKLNLAFGRSIQKHVTFEWKLISFSLLWLFLYISLLCTLCTFSVCALHFFCGFKWGTDPTTFGSCTCSLLQCHEDEALVEKKSQWERFQPSMTLLSKNIQFNRIKEK